MFSYAFGASGTFGRGLEILSELQHPQVELLQLAFFRVETSGLDALSLRGLASSLGVSKTASYRHFSNVGRVP